MAKATKWVYFFGNGKAEGKAHQKELLGGKGAGLAEMTNIGLPVPGGFTITTEACQHYHKNNSHWPKGLEKQVNDNLKKLEKACKKKLGSTKDPLLVSVRSGAAVSMPGMMETILNLGLNDESVEGLAKASGNRRFALDAYRRLIMMYGATAMGVEREHFDQAFDQLKASRTAYRLGKSPDQEIIDTEVNEEELEALIARFKEIYHQHTGTPFPQDPREQLTGAINAVFDSWNAEKAITYRRLEKITGLPGTAVNICQMVFGNMGDDSGTGVCFTRDPGNGENEFYGDLLINAQGEDVVAGVRTPVKLDELEHLMPECYLQLLAVRTMLEIHYRDMQDLEFTIERGKLYLLQCRSGKRSPAAAFKIAVDQATKPILGKAELSKLVKKKLLAKKYATQAAKPILTKDEAIQRIKPVDVERLFLPRISPEVNREQLSMRRLAEGINAVAGAACGKAVFTAARAEEWSSKGEKVILVRKETSPEDVGGMHAAQGILTATGGKTSHAAVVARGWGKCCIVGCGALRIQEGAGTMSLNGRTLPEGSTITLDGGTGEVFEGEVALELPDATDDYRTLMSWCDDRRRLRVRTNADTPQDASRAVELGAEGIGLCRTEHMFFNPDEPLRLLAMRQMILSRDEQGRRAALEKLLPYQQGDFEGIFTAMNGKPVTIRLIDPPLHEFLPHDDNPRAQHEAVEVINGPIQQMIAQVPAWELETRRQLEAQLVGIDDIRHRVEELSEFNPMLGHRGCRLLITYPEILDMQVRAIVQAAVNVAARGVEVLPEIMIPLTIDGKELRILVERTRKVAEEVLAESGAKVKYLVGTMIETPRAAITADVVAESAEFFSFGTNDLTQTTMGLSRDDAGRFLPEYVDANKSAIFPEDPFQSLDIEGVGYLMWHAVEAGRSTRPKIKLGICGEHGGDPATIRFCDTLGLDYVSCSPLRVPVARLAAAQSAMKTAAEKKTGKAKTSKSAAPKTSNRKTAKKSPGKKKSVSTTKGTGKASKKKTVKKAKKETKSRVKKSPKKKATTKRKPTTKKRRARAR